MRPLNHPRKAVVLLSGGIDSATTLAIAHAEGMELYALSFDYGQRHLRELESAKMVARSFAVKKHHIANFNLRDIGGSALTSEIAVPKNGPTTKGKGQTTGRKNASPPDSTTSRIPVTYVPARNTIFLSFALAWAEVINAEHIYIGANAVDYSGYPDCRPEYLQSFERMANLATKESVEGRLTFSIRAPLLLMTKADIVKTGLRLGLDYALTWSCYDPQPKEALGSSLSNHPEEKKRRTRKAISRELWENYAPCGLCDSCRFRERGFREAGVRDPLVL